MLTPSNTHAPLFPSIQKSSIGFQLLAVHSPYRQIDGSKLLKEGSLYSPDQRRTSFSYFIVITNIFSVYRKFLASLPFDTEISPSLTEFVDRMPPPLDVSGLHIASALYSVSPGNSIFIFNQLLLDLCYFKIMEFRADSTLKIQIKKWVEWIGFVS